MPTLQLIRTYPVKPLLLASGLSAVSFYFSTGFYDNWLLTWLAALPVCCYALQSRAGEAALAAFTAYFLGAMNQFGYLPPLTFIGATLLSAAAFSASVLLLRSLTLVNRPILAPLPLLLPGPHLNLSVRLFPLSALSIAWPIPRSTIFQSFNWLPLPVSGA